MRSSFSRLYRTTTAGDIIKHSLTKKTQHFLTKIKPTEITLINQVKRLKYFCAFVKSRDQLFFDQSFNKFLNNDSMKNLWRSMCTCENKWRPLHNIYCRMNQRTRPPGKCVLCVDLRNSPQINQSITFMVLFHNFYWLVTWLMTSKRPGRSMVK